jgi:hypothetical protein
MSPHRQEWDANLRAALSRCVGEVLTDVWVDEMGLYGPDEHPSFSHSQLEFVQALLLELRFESGMTLQVSCWQDDYEFALWPRQVTYEQRIVSMTDPARTLFRVRRMDEFPLGSLKEVEWLANDCANIHTIRLRMDSSEVILRAGEVYENPDASLIIRDQDESVLVFLNSDAHARTVFNSPVYRIE